MADICKATRRDGAPCTAWAGSDGYCIGHTSRLAEARARGRPSGSRGRSYAARARTAIPLDVREVLDQLIAALDETYGGQLEPQVAKAMATLSGAIVRMYELSELAVRIKALEERDEAADTPH